MYASDPKTEIYVPYMCKYTDNHASRIHAHTHRYIQALSYRKRTSYFANQMLVHTLIHTYIHTYIHTAYKLFREPDAGIYTYTYIHTYINIYIHTYRHSQISVMYVVP
jgi:hypothetical protein